MMNWSGFHGSLQLKNGFQVCVIPMSLSVLTSPRAREYMCIGILISCKKRRFILTDSVIYTQLKDVPQLVETGNNLGDMTCELIPYETITEFVKGGQRIMRIR